MEKDYGEKLFRGKDLTGVVNIINQEVADDFSLVEEYDGIKKWNTLPILLLESDEKAEKIQGLVTYVDDMLIEKKEKVSYLITLSSLIEHGKIKLETIDEGQVFMLMDFFRTRTVKEMTKLVRLVNTPTLIKAVRNKTLEVHVRTDILNYVVDNYVEQGIDRSTKKEFLTKMVDTIESLDYYNLWNLIHPDDQLEV